VPFKNSVHSGKELSETKKEKNENEENVPTVKFDSKMKNLKPQR
jgi:hypothetical protein